MIKTIIFDLDGTLLNTLNDLKESTNFALEKYGHPSRTIEEVRNFVGNGVKRLIELAVPKGMNELSFEQCLSDFKQHYKQNMYNSTAPYEDILELLDRLDDEGIQIAVVSNKFDAAVKELCKKYFVNRIEVAIGESQNIRKKPAPDSVFEAMKLLNAHKESTLYVGDSDVDIQTAKNAGLRSVGVSWGFRDEELLKSEGANYIIHKPLELLRIAKESD